MNDFGKRMRPEVVEQKKAESPDVPLEASMPSGQIREHRRHRCSQSALGLAVWRPVAMNARALGGHAPTRLVAEISRTNVHGLRSNQPPIAKLLEAVRRPAEHSTDRERGREELR